MREVLEAEDWEHPVGAGRRLDDADMTRREPLGLGLFAPALPRSVVDELANSCR
ncbi:MAG: hypothetical protein WB239_03585 [Acidimicrobiia bacterium]